MCLSPYVYCRTLHKLKENMWFYSKHIMAFSLIINHHMCQPPISSFLRIFIRLFINEVMIIIKLVCLNSQARQYIILFLNFFVLLKYFFNNNKIILYIGVLDYSSTPV